MKSIKKQLNVLYDYSKVLNVMPPRGDGAKDAVAMEIHQACIKTFDKLYNQLQKKPDKFVESTMLLLDLVENMLLDKVDPSYTPQELEERRHN